MKNQDYIDLLNYKISVRIIKMLLKNNLITQKEYDEIDKLNKISFNSVLCDIY